MPGQQVVTELVIDSNAAGADQFDNAMKKSATTAQETILAVAGVGVAFVGALVGLRSFYDFVGTSNKQFVDIAESAKLANMSTLEFQKTLYAARTSGVSEKDFISGLDKISDDLVQANRGATTFGKLFEANGLSIKNANGELISTQQALDKITGLMVNAGPATQRALASIVGVSKEWIPFLEQGKAGIEAQKDAAVKLGVVINDDVIEKSKEFDRQWKTAVAGWDMQFKASIASIMPLLIQLANLASKILDTVGGIGGAIGRWTTADADKTKAQLNDQIADVDRLIGMMKKLDDSGGLMRSGGMLEFQTKNLKGVLGLPEDADLERVDQLKEKLKGLYEVQRIVVTPSGGDGSTKLPAIGGGGDPNDKVDAMLNQLNKHILTQEADTKAIGLGAAALAQYRAEAQFTAAVTANGGAVTQAQKDRFLELAAAAAKAADALARAKINDDISFGRKTSLLSQDDVAIATQLRSIYPDVATALNSVEASGLRVNNALKGLSSTIETNLVSGLTDIAMGTKTVSQGFQAMGLAIVKALDEMLIKMLIVQPIMRTFQSFLGGSSLLGGSATTATASVGAVSGLAEGTQDAPGGWTWVGEKGPELMNLQPGATIIPNNQTGGTSGSTGTNISFGDTIINVPEGTSSGNAKDIAASVKEMMTPLIDERLGYHTRARGMLS